MDDTQKSRTSDANTTRKRRSSILKSQRPPRTPFSELEFNVATPTDSVKSRRVSFSRRTGVAEFITNEATTTWKNFYEEHNKSLESSGNDLEVKPPRQTIGHIGKRIFDQQFEEVEAVDFLRQFTNPSLNINTSITNINLNQQVSALEFTDNIKLSAPQTNFELSTFTETHSKLFGDELTAPTMGEMSERIAINFSDVQVIDQGNDDLDEIQRDLERAQSNIMCTGPFTDRQNMSEYIEIDLNTTHITVRNEESDMSITDTIHSPKVQDVPKSSSIDKKLNQSRDWVTDKENIALNPYITPRESVNFATNEETDKVLVFDGKRLTLESERDNKNYRQTLLPNGPGVKTPQRKTIVLNLNDDLPNFIEEKQISKNDTFKGNLSSYHEELPNNHDTQHTNRTIHDEENVSINEGVILHNVKENVANKSRTLLYDNDSCNISITQAQPAKIIQEKVTKRQTILYSDDGNVSVTQAVPSNMMLLTSFSTDKQRTMLFEEDMGHISITQSLPGNIIDEKVVEKEKMVLYEDDGISVIQDLPTNIIPKKYNNNKKKSIIMSENTNPVIPDIHASVLGNAQKDCKSQTATFTYDNTNVSMTQANNMIANQNDTLPNKRSIKHCENDKENVFEIMADATSAMSPENNNRPLRTRTIVHNDTGNISVTQAIPTNIIVPETDARQPRRNTVVYDNDEGNISVTQAIPTNIIVPETDTRPPRRNTIVYDNDAGNMSVTQAIPTNIIEPETNTRPPRRNTIVYDNDAGNISVTQAIPTNIIVPETDTRPPRRNTIVYDNDAGNISVTQAIPTNIIVPETDIRQPRRNTIVYDNDAGNISVTQAIPANIIVLETNTRPPRRNTIVYDNDEGNISVTQAIPTNIIVPETDTRLPRRNTIVYDNDAGNMSVTQAIPTNIIEPETNTRPPRRNTIVYDNDAGNISVTQAIPTNIIVPETDTRLPRRNTIVYDNDAGNMSVTQAIPTNIIEPETDTRPPRRNTIVYDNDAGNMSVTQAIPTNIIEPETNTRPPRRNTIVYDNDAGNISVTQAIPTNIMVPEMDTRPQRRNTIVYDNDASNISITQAIPATHLILPDIDTRPSLRNTIVNDDIAGNILVTRTILTDIVQENTTHKQEINKLADTILFTQETSNDMVVPDKSPEKKKTVRSKDDIGNISAARVKQSDIFQGKESFTEGKKSIYCQNECHMSVEQTIDDDTLLQENDNKSKVQNIQANIMQSENIVYEQKQMAAVENNESNISRTKAVLDNVVENQILTNTTKNVPFENYREQHHFDDDNLIMRNKDVVNKAEIKTNEINREISTTLSDINFRHLNGNKETYDSCDVLMDELQPSHLSIEKCAVKSNIIDKECILTQKVDAETPDDISNPYHEINNEEDSIIVDSQTFDMRLQGEKPSILDNCGKATITKPIPATLSSIQRDIAVKTFEEVKVECETIPVSQDVLLYQVATKYSEILGNKTTNQEYRKIEKTSSQQDFITNTALDVIEQNVSHTTAKDNIELLTNKETLKKNQSVLDESKVVTTNIFDKTVDLKKSNDDLTKEGVSDAHISKESMRGGIDDKNIMAQVASNQQLSENYRNDENCNISTESMFYITKDDEIEKKYKETKKNVLISSSLKAEEDEYVDHLQKKLVEIKKIVRDDTNCSPKNRYYEKIISSDVQKKDEKDTSESEILNSRKERKSYKSADDTDYLLQMLSDLTEEKVSDIIEEEEKQEPIIVKGRIALENKSEIPDKRRSSFIPKRQSLALNREDLLNNLSLAQAALQKSRFELTESEEDTEKDSSIEEDSPQKNAVRMSNEVVKTLNFEEDDTASETSIKSDKISPLRKTAFGETSYMKECKAKVIPSYLKDVSDNIKALMHDLVKPTAETMPFEAIGLDKSLKKNPSTCSTQIQANLIASSQIDLNIELYSNPTSTYDIRTQAAFANEMTIAGDKVISHPCKSPVKYFQTTLADKFSETELTDEADDFGRQLHPLQGPPVHGNVLVFDHENPLNNIVFAPTDCVDVHKYNPVQSNKTLCDSERTYSDQKTSNDKEIEVERVAMQFNIDSRRVLSHGRQQYGDVSADKIAGIQSLTSTISKPISIDQSIDVRTIEVKDIEVNTSITMKGNRELLEASSSLTLVDDALTQNVFDVDIETNTTTSKSSTTNKSKSPVKIINQIDECGVQSEIISSEVIANGEVTTKHKDHKRKKRNYSSIKHKEATVSDVDVTPKPICKVQKMSTTPKNMTKTVLDLHRTSPDKNKSASPKVVHVMDEEMPSPDKVERKSRRNSTDKTGTTITVQRLITEYHIETNMDQGTLNKQIVEALANQSCNANTAKSEESKSLDGVCSFTSSNNVQDKDEHSASTSPRPLSECSTKSMNCVNWQPELISEISTKNPTCECDSSVNVVAKIDMLPFMGSHECEWEWSCGDTWSFRLLHARLRLCVRLAHRHDNAARTCVRADTPVLALDVQIAQHDKNNSVASTCVRFAAETMRHVCAGGAARAGDVPALVRRCAAAARVAARWGRAMQDARARLAYTLTDDGQLALKVANIPLRSVWEVRMQLELAAGAGGAAWPRAGGVRVVRVVSEWRVAEARLRAALASVPHDWGHVPRTIWRIFKYLKNMTRDDELLTA